MYRTGDLAWYDEQGKLYFRGRKDFQIKYLGHRIELGEIEACMHNHPSCERACVIFDEKRNRLRAFFEGQLEKREGGATAARHYYYRPLAIQRAIV